MLWNGAAAPCRNRSSWYDETTGVPSGSVASWSADGENSARVGLSVGCAHTIDAETRTENAATKTTRTHIDRGRTIAHRLTPGATRSARSALNSSVEAQIAKLLKTTHCTRRHFESVRRSRRKLREPCTVRV